MTADRPVTIITGASRGIGRATAKEFAENGVCVVGVARSAADLSSLKAELHGENHLMLTKDLSEPNQISDIFASVQEKYQRLDMLVNNAAILGMAPLSDMTLEKFEQVMRINVSAVMLCCKAAFSQMTNGGSIVNVSSLAGIPFCSKFPGFSAYSASKFAVSGLTEILAAEGRDRNIRVNAIAPGGVETDMLKEVQQDLASETSPEDIAKVIWFLADTTASKPITGCVLPIFTRME